MSEEKQTDNDPEKTLLTLDQLSQTIEVMTSVVNRLRQHLSEQIKAQASAAALREAEQRQSAAEQQDAGEAKAKNSKDSFVVEIKQQEADVISKDNKTLH